MLAPAPFRQEVCTGRNPAAGLPTQCYNADGIGGAVPPSRQADPQVITRRDRGPPGQDQQSERHPPWPDGLRLREPTQVGHASPKPA